MTTTETSICNGALIKLGAELILSLDDNSNRARLLKASYPRMRDFLLRGHPWKFNKAFAALARVIPTPPEIFGYQYLYALPSDCARVFESEHRHIHWEEVEGGIITNAESIRIKYGRLITDCTKFDAAFVETLEWAIANDCAYTITQSTAQQDNAKKQLENNLAKARSYSAQTGRPQQVQANHWLYARRGWRG